MGIFDPLLYSGEKFSKEEKQILDENFNSISAYTKKKYKFYRREDTNNMRGSHMGINFHRITYSHKDIDTDEFNPNHIVYINCDMYWIKNERFLDAFEDYFELPFDDKDAPRLKVPVVKKFPARLLVVGFHGSGFIAEFKYKMDSKIDRILEDSSLTNDCIKKINSECVKYLKNFHK